MEKSEQIKNLRVKLDGLYRAVNPRVSGYSKLDEAKYLARLAKAALGIVLGTIGEQTPYKKDGMRKDVKDIEPTADVMNLKGVLLVKYNGVIGFREQDNKYNDKLSYTYPDLIESVDWYREQFLLIGKEIMDIKTGGTMWSYEASIWLTEAYLKAMSARITLGFLLGDIRDEVQKEENR